MAEQAKGLIMGALAAFLGLVFLWGLFKILFRSRKLTGWGRNRRETWRNAETDSPIEELLLRAIRQQRLPEPSCRVK